MLKVLYLITKDDVGGAQKYVRDLADNLDKEIFDAQILTGGQGGLPNRRAGLRFLSNTYMPYLLFLNDWLAVWEIFFRFRKIQPDIIHLNSSKAGVVGALAAWMHNLLLAISHKPKVKVVFTAHGWVFNPDNHLGFLRRNFYSLLHRLAARFQDIIINVSEYDRKLAIENKIAPIEKLITIHNGLDYQSLKFLDKTTARKTISTLLKANNSKLKADEIWIGSIGRLVVEKNYENFVEAAAQIQNQNVKFFIIGNGPEKNKLQSLITNYQLQNRFFLVEDLAPAAPYLKAFDIFVLSSIKEGLPYTLLEAMAAKRPIIVTRVGGMPEIVDDLKNENEGRGIVVLPREPHELARAIEYILENPKMADLFGENSSQALKNQLGLETMLEKTSALYKN